MQEPVIEVRGLYKSYGNVHAVNGIDITVNRGDIYGFLGPNGAGKSTTIRMMLSLVRPTAGTISIFGKPLSQHRHAILSNVGCIVERPDFYNYLSARRNLELLAMLSGAVVSKETTMRTLEMVGLASRADSKVKTFSHGMKQRLGIAQALIHNPELIILDEPTTGLDPQGMIDVRNIIVRLARDHGKTVVLSSHLLSEVEQTINRMVIINKGKVLVEGNVDDLVGQNGLEELFIRLTGEPQS